MDDEEIVERIRDTTRAGIDALEHNDVDQASVRFAAVLDLCDEIDDDRARRDEYALLAGITEARFPDLALSAAEEAVDLDRTLELENKLPQDLIAVGNAHLNMQNTPRAEELYRQALDILLEQEDWANAASANTNLGAIAADRGDLAGALQIFETSLGYLARSPFEHTEVQTRFALLQVYEFEDIDVERALANATELWDRLFDELHPVQREAGAGFLEQLCERYLQAHPEIDDGEAWRAAAFPRVYG